MQGTDGEVLGINLVVLNRSKPGVGEGSRLVLSGGSFEGRSHVEFLWVKVGTKVGPSDGMPYGGNLWKIDIGSWRRNIYGYPLGVHLVQNMELPESPLVIYPVENLRVQNWGNLVLRHIPLVIWQMKIDMASLRDIH